MTSAAERLRAEIRERGPVPFARFMEEALYGEEGYYRRPEPPIGEGGDFVTGSSLSPLFGRATARLVRRLDAALGRPAEVLEAGYGTGAHLDQLAAALAPLGDRPVWGWDRVPRPLGRGARAVAGLEVIESVAGLVFSYELFDALPVHRLIATAEGLAELWVELDGEGGFAWRRGELSDPALAALPGAPLESGQIADLSPGWRPLYRELARRLERGLLVTCDYGFTADKLLDARVRRHGTLACHRRHRVHRDPFLDVGAQDLTAHVDFSALVEEGEAAGLETVALTRQAPWLAACGLLEELRDADPATRVDAQNLMQLDGMGEEIRVLVQARDIDPGRVLPLSLLRRASPLTPRGPGIE